MPRHFSKEEKKIIKERLMTKGKELFSTIGLKKTTIEDLTETVGIAKGSFYSFFDSKEELYFIVMEAEAEKIRQKFKEDIINKFPVMEPEEIMKQMLSTMLEVLETNPLINRIYNTDDLSLIYQKINNNQLEEHKQLSLNAFLPFIKNLQEQGELIIEKPEVIMGVIRAIPLVSFHKEELGKDIYPEIIDLLIEMVAEGLVKKQ